MSDHHNGLPVAGYRPQPMAKIDLVNQNKALEEQSLRAIDALKLDPDVDQRWLATGRTDLEKAWMSINRSIFKPGRVNLDGDVA